LQADDCTIEIGKPRSDLSKVFWLAAILLVFLGRGLDMEGTKPYVLVEIVSVIMRISVIATQIEDRIDARKLVSQYHRKIKRVEQALPYLNHKVISSRIAPDLVLAARKC